MTKQNGSKLLRNGYLKGRATIDRTQLMTVGQTRTQGLAEMKRIRKTQIGWEGVTQTETKSHHNSLTINLCLGDKENCEWTARCNAEPCVSEAAGDAEPCFVVLLF